MVATMVILICNNACNSPNINVWILGGAATMVAGIETFNRARILELQQFSWKRITKQGSEQPLDMVRQIQGQRPNQTE